MKNSFAELRRLFVLTFSDCRRMLRHMWRVPLVVLGVTGLQAFARYLLDRVITTQIGISLAHTLLEVAGAWIVAPYLVALFRFALTDSDERAERLRGSPSTDRFFAWSAVFAFVVGAPELLTILIRGSTTTVSALDTPEGFTTLWVKLAFTAITGACLARLITLLPATAMNDPKSPAQAFAETRGHFWFIIAAAALPAFAASALAFVAAFVLTLLVHLVATGVNVRMITELVLIALLLFLTFVGTSVAARFYQRLSPQPVRPKSPSA